MSKSIKIPIWEKAVITMDEAAAYSSIGINKLYSMTSDPCCTYVLRNGNRKLIKRKEFDQFLACAIEI